MSRRLNRSVDEGIRWLIESDQETVDEGNAGWKTHFELACHRYQQEDPVPIVRHHLVQAVDLALDDFSHVTKENKNARRAWDFALVLGAACAVGTSEQRKRTGELERWRWFSPETELETLHAAALTQLQTYLAGHFYEERARTVIEMCNDETADRSAVRFHAPMVEVLIAIAARDEANVTRLLLAMVEEHRHDALYGSLQLGAEGMIAIVPLGLARLAREAGISPNVSSPYVPLELLSP